MFHCSERKSIESRNKSTTYLPTQLGGRGNASEHGPRIVEADLRIAECHIGSMMDSKEPRRPAILPNQRNLLEPGATSKQKKTSFSGCHLGTEVAKRTSITDPDGSSVLLLGSLKILLLLDPTPVPSIGRVLEIYTNWLLITAVSVQISSDIIDKN